MSAPQRHRPERIDWEALDDGPVVGRRTLAYAAGLAALAAAFGYVEFLRVSDAPVLGVFEPTYQEWLLSLGLLTLARFVAWPLTADRERAGRYWRRLRSNPVGLAAFVFLVGFLLVGTFGPAAVGERQTDLYDQFQPPVFGTSDTSVTSPCVGQVTDEQCHGTWQYPLGTNRDGIGVVWLLANGARVSLLVALVAALAVAPLAIVVGVLAGYYGGAVDELLMRYVDLQESMPAFLVYIFVAALTGDSLLVLLAAFGLLSWGGVARLVRSETLQRKEAAYVRAARNAGASRLYVVRRHVVPNVASTALTATTQLIPRLILTEAAASFLYLTDANTPSWGVTLAKGLSGRYASFPPIYSIRAPGLAPTVPEKWWVATFVTAALVVTIVAFAVFGDALRDVLDPRAGVGGDG